MLIVYGISKASSTAKSGLDPFDDPKQVAKTKRVREATLLRRWVIEKLHASSSSARRR